MALQTIVWDDIERFELLTTWHIYGLHRCPVQMCLLVPCNLSEFKYSNLPCRWQNLTVYCCTGIGKIWHHTLTTVVLQKSIGGSTWPKPHANKCGVWETWIMQVWHLSRSHDWLLCLVWVVTLTSPFNPVRRLMLYLEFNLVQLHPHTRHETESSSIGSTVQ